MPYLVSLGRFIAGGSERGGEGRTVNSEGRDDEWEGRMGI